MPAVRGIDFDVNANQVLGIVGESGSGKSVAALAISGLLPPTAQVQGSIQLEGVEVTTLDAESLRRIRGRDVGMVFQDPTTTLNPVFPIGRQVIEGQVAHGQVAPGQAAQRAVDLLREVDIPDPQGRVDQYPHQFSGGMRQRVVIALALAAEPELIVADEPTTALDVSIQAQIISLIRRLCKEHGTAVMLVTHDMGVIAETCDRVAVMYAGRIVEIGPVHDVIHAPAHPYSHGLMGSIPAMGEDRERLLQIDGVMPRLNAIPSGCAFHPRCPKSFARCRQERPNLLGAGATRAACWLHATVSDRQ